MKTITLTIQFDDTGCYKGHGDDTAELIKDFIENEMRYCLQSDGVIKEGWKISLESQDASL